MKTRIFFAVVFLVMISHIACAQDTIGLAEPPEVYYHNNWVDSSMNPTTNISGCACLEIGKEFYVDKGTLTVYGIAAVATTVLDYAIDPYDPIWEMHWYGIYDTTLSNDAGEYYRLYKKITPDTADTTIMEIVAEARMNVLDSNVVGYFDRGEYDYFHPEYQKRYVPIRAAYFDEPVEVEESFWAGMTFYRSLKYWDENGQLWQHGGIPIKYIVVDELNGHVDESIFNHWVNPRDTTDRPEQPWQFWYNPYGNGTYTLIFPLLDTLPMYASPLVTGGDMAGAPVVTMGSFVSVAPNPATETATVTSSFELSGVELYDLGGVLLLSQPASGLSHTLDLRPYPAGTYILKARTPAGTATQKIIKQ